MQDGEIIYHLAGSVTSYFEDLCFSSSAILSSVLLLPTRAISEFSDRKHLVCMP